MIDCDRWQTGGLSNVVISNKLVLFDLQKLPLTLHMECLEGSEIGIEKSPGFGCIQ